MLGFTCQAVRGFPSFAPCLEHVCAGGGGSVAIEGFVLYVGGDYALHLNTMLLVQVMAYVMSGTFAHGALDMHTRIRPADWCARGSDIAWDLCRRLESQSSRTVSLKIYLELLTGADVFII